MTEAGWPPKVGILYEMVKNMSGGFSGPIKIAHNFVGRYK